MALKIQRRHLNKYFFKKIVVGKRMFLATKSKFYSCFCKNEVYWVNLGYFDLLFLKTLSSSTINIFFRVGNRLFDLPDLPSSVLTARRTGRTGEPRCDCETGPTSKKKWDKYYFLWENIYTICPKITCSPVSPWNATFARSMILLFESLSTWSMDS